MAATVAGKHSSLTHPTVLTRPFHKLVAMKCQPSGCKPAGCGRLAPANRLRSVQRVGHSAHRGSGERMRHTKWWYSTMLNYDIRSPRCPVPTTATCCACSTASPLHPLPGHAPAGLDPPRSLKYDWTVPSATVTADIPTFVGQPVAGQGVSWSDLGRLSGVFPFKHLRASADQTAPTWLLTQLQQFVATLQKQVGAGAVSSWKGAAGTP